MPDTEKTLVKIDKLDRKILEQLQKDGSLTNQQLAEKVGLSPSPCLRRVRALEEAGIIVRTVTILDHKKTGAVAHRHYSHWHGPAYTRAICRV